MIIDPLFFAGLLVSLIRQAVWGRLSPQWPFFTPGSFMKTPDRCCQGKFSEAHQYTVLNNGVLIEEGK
jgi:hypothetical protein